jgi:hypothetical protein
MTTTSSARHPSAFARWTRPYWRAVDSVFSQTWAIDDCRT